jgi:hypothetical protein
LPPLRRQILVWAVAFTALGVRTASAGGLGIALDGFLTTFLTFATGLGGIIFMLGMCSYVYQWISSPHSPLMSNSLTYVVLGGLLGGTPIIGTQLGLISGALLP